MESGEEDPEERRKRMAAEQSGADIGTLLGLAVGAVTALTREEREAYEQEENNEYYVHNETQWRQSM